MSRPGSSVDKGKRLLSPFDYRRRFIEPISYIYNYAPVAQWIEQETSKLLAVGSIPTRGTILDSEPLRRLFVSVEVRF